MNGVRSGEEIVGGALGKGGVETSPRCWRVIEMNMLNFLTCDARDDLYHVEGYGTLMMCYRIV